MSNSAMWAPPPAAPSAQWTPLITPSPKIWTAQPVPPVAAAYTTISPLQKIGLPQDFQTPSDPPSHLSSGNHEAGETEEAEDVGVTPMEEKDAVTRRR